MAHLFVARVEDEILDLAERAVAARACSSSSSSLAARLTCEDDRLSMPNSRITASTSRVGSSGKRFTGSFSNPPHPLMYISATASSEEDPKTVRGTVFLTNARTERRPRSSDCGERRFPSCPAVLGTCTVTVPAGVSILLGFVPLA